MARIAKAEARAPAAARTARVGGMIKDAAGKRSKVTGSQQALYNLSYKAAKKAGVDLGPKESKKGTGSG